MLGLDDRYGSEPSRPYKARWKLGAALYSSTALSLSSSAFVLVPRFRVQKGICLTILDEAYVSKIAVLRETNLQDCNPSQNIYMMMYSYTLYRAVCLKNGPIAMECTFWYCYRYDVLSIGQYVRNMVLLQWYILMHILTLLQIWWEKD